MAQTPRATGKPDSGYVSCFSCQWRQRSEWCVLARDDVEFLNGAKRTRSYPAKQSIFRQGDPCTGVYSILSGAVSVRKLDPQGNSVLVRLRYEGETIGYRDFFSGGVFTTSAETLEPSQICFIESRSVRKLLDRNPTLGLSFLTRVAGDLQSVEESLLRSVSLTARIRLVHLLLALKDRYAVADDEGTISIRLPLSRQDIADILGSRAETVARLIQGLERDGVARFSGRLVVIPDLDLLLDELEPKEL